MKILFILLIFFYIAATKAEESKVDDKSFINLTNDVDDSTKNINNDSNKKNYHHKIEPKLIRLIKNLKKKIIHLIKKRHRYKIKIKTSYYRRIVEPPHLVQLR